MKRTLFRMLNVIMAVVVLVSSTGFGLIEHSCQMRGKKITKIGTVESTFIGCPPGQKASAPSQPSLKKGDCCQDEHRYENVDISSSLSQLVAKFFKIATEGLITTVEVVVTSLVNWLFIETVSTVEHSPNAPPPAYGRSLLAVVQSFLI